VLEQMKIIIHTPKVLYSSDDWLTDAL